MKNFERAMGRPVMWSDRTPEDRGKRWSAFKKVEKEKLFALHFDAVSKGFGPVRFRDSTQEKLLSTGRCENRLTQIR